jgi:predicted dehydrogenase
VNLKRRQVQGIAVVGTGYFSQFHLNGWQRMAGVNVVAVCDLDQERASRCAQERGIPHAVSRSEDLFALEGIDLVDITTPSSGHGAWVRAAVARDIAVICQKPFATRYTEALALTELAEQAGVPLVIHENFRFMPWYREMRRHIEAGLLGKLHNVSFRLRPGDGQGPQAYLDRQAYFQQLPRFLVAETAVHFIDTFRYLCGEVSSVYAHLRRLNPTIAGEDAGVIHFEFANGAAGLFDGNRLNDHVADNPRRTMGEMWLEGERGVLRLDGDAHLHFKPHHGDEKRLDYHSGDPSQFGSGACQALQEHVVSCVQSGIQAENAARDYLSNLRIQEAVYASNAKGCRVHLADFLPPELPLLPVFT